MVNAKEIGSYLRAGYSGIWIVTKEPRRAIKALKKLIEGVKRKDGRKYQVGVWSCLSDPKPTSPLVKLDEASELTVLFLRNYHWFINKPDIVQKIQDSIEVWSNSGKAIVVVSSEQKIPKEIKEDFVLMEFALPDADDINESIDHISKSGGKSFTLPSKKLRKEIVDNSKGLTQMEVENTLARSLHDTGGFDVSLINEQRAAIVETSGYINVFRPTITLNDLKGYGNVKDYALSMVGHPLARGMLLIGPAGTGKTRFMEALVGSTNILGLDFDIGKLTSKFQGEFDSNMDAVINLILAVGKCIVVIDEFEKQFSGAGADGSTDGGTMVRGSSKWLRFMQDRPKDIYMIGACNTFKGIPPAYLRPGRWDCAPIFVDLPNTDEKADIMKYWTNFYKLDSKQELPEMDRWAGSEIEACTRNAHIRHISIVEAAKKIIPAAITNADEVNRLREWAKGRTTPASESISNGGGIRMLDI